MGEQPGRCSKGGERKGPCAVRTSAILFFVFAAAATAATLSAVRPVAARTHHVVHIARPVLKVAPADEYFGRLKMSILGIRNQLHDLALRVQYTPDSGEAVLGSATMVEDAVRDWERKYPADPWLAKSVYELTSLYARVHTDRGRDDAQRALQWLLNRYGRTAYALQAKTLLQPQVGLR